jgi:hypothetical protein
MKPISKDFRAAIDDPLGFKSLNRHNDVSIQYGLVTRAPSQLRCFVPFAAAIPKISFFVDVTLLATHATARHTCREGRLLTSANFRRIVASLRAQLLRQSRRDSRSLPRAGASRIKKSPRNKRKKSRRFS